MTPAPQHVATIAACTLLLLAGGCAEKGSEAAPSAEPAPVPVEVARVETRPQRPAVRVTADLGPRHRVTVAAESAGRITRLAVDVGDRVARGAVLARLDATKVGHSLSLHAAEIDRARAALDKARQDLQRVQRLAGQGVAAQAKLDDARSAVRLAEAALKATRARHQLTASRAADARVRAPFSGTISARHVERGDYVTPGRPLVALVDLSALMVEAGVPAAQVGNIAVGDACTVRVSLPAPVTARGKVTAVGAEADPATRRVQVKVEIADADPRLKPGMIAEVTFVLGAPVSTILVPASAIVEQFDIPYAFVVEQGRAVRRRLVLGPQRGTERVVREGLAPGERLVVVGQESLAPRTPVRVVPPRRRPRGSGPDPS